MQFLDNVAEFYVETGKIINRIIRAIGNVIAFTWPAWAIYCAVMTVHFFVR